MKVIELLKICRNLLETLQNSCINIKDVRFVEMYEEYEHFMEQKHKITYIAATLSEKYGISERKFFYLIKRFEEDCNFLAV